MPQKAVVFIRHLSAPTLSTPVRRVYLALADIEADKGGFLPPEQDCIYATESTRSSRRFRTLVSHFDHLAARINAGRISFEYARHLA